MLHKCIRETVLLCASSENDGQLQWIWKNDTGELSEGEMSHGFYEGRRLKALISSLFLVLLLRPCLSVSNESSSKIKWLCVRESMRSCRTAVHGEAGVVVSIAYESAGKDKQKECIEVHSSPSWTNTKKKTQVGAAGRIFRFVIPENMNSVLIVEGNLENRLYRVSRFSGRTGEEQQSASVPPQKWPWGSWSDLGSHLMAHGCSCNFILGSMTVLAFSKSTQSIYCTDREQSLHKSKILLDEIFFLLPGRG